MTDPRPRVTNKTGNAQQTSVVSTVVNATIALPRSVRMSPLHVGGAPTAKEQGPAWNSDSKRTDERIGRTVEPLREQHVEEGG
jgi:hypothetical protein